MIVQCEQCATRFRLDDAKVGEQGVKVRCSKCRFVFVVKKERLDQVAEEPDFDALLSGLGRTSSIPATQELAAPMATADSPDRQAASSIFPEQKQAEVPETPVVSEESTVNDWLSNFAPESRESADASHGGESDTSGISVEPTEVESAIAEPQDWFDTAAMNGGGTISDAQWPESAQDTVAEHQQEPAGEEISFASEPWPETAPAIDDTVEGESSEAPSHSWESDIEPSEAAMDQPVPSVMQPEEPVGEFTFEPAGDQGEGDFHSAEGLAEPVTPDKDETEAPAPPDEITWDIDRSEKTNDFVSAAVHRFESQSAIASEVEDKNLAAQSEVAPPPVADVPVALSEEELPPLSIASRRKGSSIFPAAITVVSVLFIIVLAGVGFYMLNEGPAAFNKFGIATFAKWAGLNSGEEGSITLRDTKGEFLNNKEIGDIFVVKGEAVNAYAKPRASIQIKASLYAAQKGQPIMTKTAYCGNLLTREQLITLPLAKLEAIMGNQFGDSLANLGVQPGKAIPFVIVFANVPREAGEFGLEVVGSTVAGP